MMINFITPYRNDYTVPYEPENKNEFKTKYINREIDTVISGKIGRKIIDSKAD